MSVRAQGEPTLTRQEIAVLMNMPPEEIGGFVVIALKADGGTPRLSADTGDPAEVMYMLAYVIGSLALSAKGHIPVEHA